MNMRDKALSHHLELHVMSDLRYSVYQQVGGKIDRRIQVRGNQIAILSNTLRTTLGVGPNELTGLSWGTE